MLEKKGLLERVTEVDALTLLFSYTVMHIF